MDSKMMLAAMLGILVLCATLSAGFFLHSSAVTLSDVTSMSFSVLKTKVLSVDFILFVVFLGILAGIIGAGVAVLDRTIVLAGGIGGLVIGILIAGIAFDLFAFAIPMSALALGAALGAWSAGLKRLELKSFVIPRTAMNTAGMLGMVLAAGLFVWSITQLLPQQQSVGDHFVDSMLDFGLQQGTNGAADLQEAMIRTNADISVRTQREMLDQITSLDSFAGLRENTDASSQSFVAQMDAVDAQINAPGYGEMVRTQFQNQVATQPASTEPLRAELKKTLSEQAIFKAMLDNIALILSVGLVFSFLFVNSMVIRPVAGIIGWGFGLLFVFAKRSVDASAGRAG